VSGTSGLSSGANGVAQLVIAALNGGTALAITGPLKVLFLSAVRSTNNGTDTEWSSGGSYVAGTGQAGPTWNAASPGAAGATQTNSTAVSQTNCPAVNWAGNIIKDSAGTPKEIWYAALTGGTKAINAGDTCTIASGSLSTALG
jgi:hypothetical protein